MCANYTPSKREAFSHHYGLDRGIFDNPAEAFPGYLAPILRESRETVGQVECLNAVFGMVPHWADMKLARQTYNARTETVASKASFRNAWKRNQFCIIPAENFYEPNYETGKPVRWRIAHAEQRPLSIAGIWEWKANGPDDLPVISFSMLTINADGHAVMSRFHKPGDEKRMLVLLDPEQYQPWLEGALVNDPQVYQPYPSERLVTEEAPLPPRTKAKGVQASLL
ncbi:SOS response-associated peptidase [Massilia sp. PAMC28688]|uniref:SOS response-associated peptidase n=1 Tax=Massilia sp. PAMC28688 TaxID=2861283 RepID=UPI001C62A126|nr:SOS response-associated peptidase family protein [Massilia sp. PAMC28688]QYF93538.1 SOS response-associated peptidase [Massilia sp. PAMC28688]